MKNELALFVIVKGMGGMSQENQILKCGGYEVKRKGRINEN